MADFDLKIVNGTVANSADTFSADVAVRSCRALLAAGWTAPDLLAIVREGVRREVPYELEGRLDIDIPLTPPVVYRTEGAIRLNSGGL